ncbi:MAG: hypothetical protein HYU63_08590 [Armatimonadetes bacterium]|nr:hypothetical protein [Armatimonadota bacterium]
MKDSRLDDFQWKIKQLVLKKENFLKARITVSNNAVRIIRKEKARILGNSRGKNEALLYKLEKEAQDMLKILKIND